MQRLWAFSFIWIAFAAHAGEVRIQAKGGGLLLSILSTFEPRTAPPVSPHHLQAPVSLPPADACTWVAGVRHCPLPKPSAEPR